LKVVGLNGRFTLPNDFDRAVRNVWSISICNLPVNVSVVDTFSILLWSSSWPRNNYRLSFPYRFWTRWNGFCRRRGICRYGSCLISKTYLTSTAICLMYIMNRTISCIGRLDSKATWTLQTLFLNLTCKPCSFIWLV
jgi:hypothetical protein